MISCPTPGEPPTRLTVGVDYNATSLSAARHALSIARLFTVPVHLLHATSSPYARQALKSDAPHATFDEHSVLHALEREETLRMEQFVASLGVADVITWSVESGDPKRVLLDHSEEDPKAWLVLGARQHTAISEWFLGSTAGYIVRHCQAPVLVIPPIRDSLSK
jgi:nucleotide-binding universal stress UspA family protein